MTTRWPTWIILGLTLTFLIGPFLIIIFAGLSAGNSLAFPPQGLSLKWYLKVSPLRASTPALRFRCFWPYSEPWPP